MPASDYQSRISETRTVCLGKGDLAKILAEYFSMPEGEIVHSDDAFPIYFKETKPAAPDKKP